MTAKRPVSQSWRERSTDVFRTPLEGAGFDVLVTADQSIPDQQNMANRKIALVILCARTNRLSDLTRLVPAALDAITTIKPGDVVRISAPLNN